MKGLLLLSIILLTGCTNSLDDAKQDYGCKDKGGVYQYATFKGQMATCRDGSLLSWNKNILPPEYRPPQMGK